MGSVDFKNQNLLDAIYSNLNPADLGEKVTFSRRISLYFGKFKTTIKRIIYRIFIDQKWHDEKEAHELLRTYAWDKECREALKPQNSKIMLIYDRLAHLSKGGGTWADGIDRELLVEEKESSAVEKLTKREQITLDEVFEAEALEEQILDEPVSPQQEIVADVRGQSYTCTRQEKLTPPSTRMLFHIQADEFGSSSQLAGGQAENSVKYLYDFLSGSRSSYSQKSLLELLGGALNPENEVEPKKIGEAFKAQKPLLIMGGWAGRPSGHAIYYEIIPNSTSSATFRIYNTGAGIVGYHPSGIKGHKVKYQAYTEWKEVSRERLESTQFLQAMHELGTRSDAEYTEVDIYQGLKELLQPKSEEVGLPVEIDESLLMTPQRSGVCSWRSLMALVRTRMDLSDYKRFKCDIRLQSLVDYVAAHPRNIEQYEWRLVKKSHQKLSRSLLKLHQKKLVGADYLQKAQGELKQVSDWVKTHSHLRYTRQVASLPTHYEPVGGHAIKNRHSFPQALHEMQTTEKRLIRGEHLRPAALQAMQQIDVTDPEKVGHALETLVTQAQTAWQQQNDQVLHKGLIDFVTRLELDEAFWQKAVQQDVQIADKLITNLGVIAKLFTKSCFTTEASHVIFSEKIYVMHKVLYLQERICHLGHPKWQDFRLVGDASDPLLNSKQYPGRPHEETEPLFLTFLTPKMQREMKKMVPKYERKFGDQQYAPSICVHGIKNDTRPSTDWQSRNKLRFIFTKEEPSESLQSYTFQDLLRQEHPEIVATVAANEPLFQTSPKFTQDAMIFTSKKLPSWITAMRDAKLASLYVKQSTVGALASLDRENDLEFSFTRIDQKEKSQVSIQVVGVDKNVVEIPEVKKIQDHPYLRYAGQYRAIQSPVITKFIDFLIAEPVFEEKELLIMRAQEFEIDMLDEEFRELARLFAQPEIGCWTTRKEPGYHTSYFEANKFSNLQHIEVLEYFTKHPEKLLDPDYQTLLHILLFKTGLLDESLAVVGFSEQLAHFVQKKYQYFSEENQIQAAVFFLKLANQLREFCPECDFYGQTIKNVQALLMRKDLQEDVKSHVFAELVVEFGRKKELSEEEIALFMIGSIYLEENQQQSKFPLDPTMLKEVREARIIHADAVQRALSKGNPNQTLLNKISKALRPFQKSDEKWTVVDDHFETKNKSYCLYPLLPLLVSQGAEVLLPVSIRANPLFQKLFSGIEKGVLHQNSVFSFQDSKGCETLVCLKGDLLVIEQKQEGKWFRFVPPSFFTQEVEAPRNEMLHLLGSHYLAEHYVHWQSLERSADGAVSIYAADPNTGSRQYHIVARAQGATSIRVDRVETISESLRLSKTSTLFTGFEDPMYIHEWFDKTGNLKKIELPRFALSFTPKPGNPEVLVCEQFPGYILNTKDSVKLLGVHQNYILLENANKQKKVILPHQDFLPVPKKEVLEPLYEIDRKPDNSGPQEYYVFDLNENGLLTSKSKEAEMYLTFVLATAQEYSKAAVYLKKFGTKLSAYTKNEAKSLQDLANIDQITGDTSANGTVLQLYAGFLLLKNSFSHHKKYEDTLAALRNQYDRYINVYSNVTLFKLKPEEEIFLLKMYLSQAYNSIYYMRLKELDPLAASQIEVPVAKAVKKQTGVPLAGLKIPYSLNDNSVPRAKFLLTRPQQEMQRHFFYFYEIARKGSPEEKEQLKASLAFVRVAEKGKYAPLAYFFDAALQNPEIFPEPLTKANYKIKYPDETEYGAARNWAETVRALAEKELQGVVVAAVGEDKPEMVVAEGFYLEKTVKAKDGAFKPFTISLPSLTTFAEQSKRYFKEVTETRKKEVGQLSKVLDHLHCSDPVQNQEVDRLLQDLQAYTEEARGSVYTLTKNNLAAVKKVLLKNKDKDKKALKNLESEILDLANKRPESEALLTELQFKQWGKLTKVITLEELIVAFARQDFHKLLERNPVLQERDLIQLAEKVGSFLLLATLDQQRMRSEECIQKIEQSSEDKRHDLVNQLAELLLAKRSYDPVQRPAYLAFEYFADICMRPVQTEKLEKFLSGGEPNLVMEMIMGSGKSKVLLPLLGLLRADGKTLSMLIVPQPLFESVSQDTQVALQAFSQSLSALHFDRHTNCSKERLELIYDQLKATRDNKECLIMTSKSIQCLLIKCIEEFSAHMKHANADTKLPAELKLMQKILSIISECGYPIIDEADTVLNILHEVSFSMGGKVSVKVHELEVLSELFRLLYEDPEIKSLARLESDPQPDAKAPVFTSELYTGQLQRVLATRFIDRLTKMTFASATINQKIHECATSLTDEKKAHLLHFLCRDKSHIKSAQSFFDSLDDEVKDVIALAGEEISHLLPHTLGGICDEKYGVDATSSNPIAIPFSASQSPSRGSQFSNAHVTMNYTFQAYMKKGITPKVVKDQLLLLQQKAMREVAESGGKLEIDDTSAGKLFKKLRGDMQMPLFNFRESDIEQLVSAINKNCDTKLFFVSSVILPQLEQSKLKISCNPHNLVSFFAKAAGFTGTLWNAGSMHHTLQPEPAVGTDAKTLWLLWQKSRSNAVTIKEGSIQSMLQQLHDKSVSYDMISDAGGYFKEGSNSSMAHQIATNMGKEVVFYNAQGEQTITDGAKEIPLSHSDKSPDERLTFLDQSHTTGADVRQKMDAVSLVTIGRNMLLRDLLQSVWRLRGLEKSQAVQFLISEEVAGIIRQRLALKKDHPIQLNEILQFVISNQAVQQGRDNYKALGRGFANIVQKMFMKVLLNEKLTQRARMNAFMTLESSWIALAAYSSRELYGTLPEKVDGARAVELDKKNAIAKIKQIFVELPWLEKLGITLDESLKEIELVVSAVKEAIPAELDVPTKEIDNDQTVEIETEVQTETELEIQEVKQKEKAESLGSVTANKTKRVGTFREAKACSDEMPLFPLRSYLESNEKLKPYAVAFEGIDIALNALEWTNKKSDYELLGEHRIDFHHLLVTDMLVTLLSQKEAVVHRESSEYYNLTLGFNEPKKKLPKELQYKIIKLKFLNGETHYSPDECVLLKKWIRAQGVKEMQTLLFDHILKGYPKKIARYQGSPLQKLFAEL